MRSPALVSGTTASTLEPAAQHGVTALRWIARLVFTAPPGHDLSPARSLRVRPHALLRRIGSEGREEGPGLPGDRRSRAQCAHLHATATGPGGPIRVYSEVTKKGSPPCRSYSLSLATTR